METTTDKKVLLTVPAELIPGIELEFEKDRYGDYTSELRASLTVKVGNDTRKLTLRKGSIYTPAVYAYDEEGKRKLVTESKEEKYMGVHPQTHEFEDFERMGIAVDVTAVNALYAEAAEKARLENIAKRKAQVKTEYEKSWMHIAYVVFNESKKRPVGMTATKSEMGTVDEDGYFHGKNPQLTLTYKEQSVALTYERVNGEYRYKIYGNITPGYNGKYYRTMDMAIAKFASFVDEKIAVQNATISREEREKAERQAKKKKLAETLGCDIAITKEYRSGHNRHTGYYEYTYNVIVIPEVKDERGNIQMYGKYVKVDEYKSYSEKDTVTYSVGGINGLTLEKAKAIIKILLDE